MLMIVGLVLFIIVSFVLYLSKSAVKKQSQQSIKKTQETAMDTKPIKEFVNKCLDKLAKDAVVLIGDFIKNLQNNAEFSRDFTEIRPNAVAKGAIGSLDIMKFELLCQSN